MTMRTTGGMFAGLSRLSGDLLAAPAPDLVALSGP